MSVIPTKQIDGDVAVGRNVHAGGNASVQGSATVNHNLTVKGWLDAKNIKGVNKGLFASNASLDAAYPLPQPGWYALVGDSLPAALYRVEDGAWVTTGGQGGQPTLDAQNYAEALAALETACDDNADAIAALVPVSARAVDVALLGLVPMTSEAQNDILTETGSWKLYGYVKKGGMPGVSPLDNGIVTFDANGNFSMAEDNGSIIEGGSFAQMSLTGDEGYTLYYCPEDGSYYMGFSGGAFPLIHDSAEDVDELYRVEFIDGGSHFVIELTRPSGDGLDTVERLRFRPTANT